MAEIFYKVTDNISKTVLFFCNQKKIDTATVQTGAKFFVRVQSNKVAQIQKTSETCCLLKLEFDLAFEQLSQKPTFYEFNKVQMDLFVQLMYVMRTHRCADASYKRMYCTLYMEFSGTQDFCVEMQFGFLRCVHQVLIIQNLLTSIMKNYAEFVHFKTSDYQNENWFQ